MINSDAKLVLENSGAAVITDIYLHIASFTTLIGDFLPLEITRLDALDLGQGWEVWSISAVSIVALIGLIVGALLFRIIIIACLILVCLYAFETYVAADFRHVSKRVDVPLAPSPEAAKQIVLDSLERQGAINKSTSIFKLESISLQYYRKDNPESKNIVQVGYTLKGYFTKTPKQAYALLKSKSSKQHLRKADLFLRRNVLGERVVYGMEAEIPFKKWERIEVTGNVELIPVSNFLLKDYSTGWRIGRQSGQRGYDVINICWQCRWDLALRREVYHTYYPTKILNDISSNDNSGSLRQLLEDAKIQTNFWKYK